MTFFEQKIAWKKRRQWVVQQYDKHNLSYAEIGRELGLSRSRIRAIYVAEKRTEKLTKTKRG